MHFLCELDHLPAAAARPPHSNNRSTYSGPVGSPILAVPNPTSSVVFLRLRSLFCFRVSVVAYSVSYLSSSRHLISHGSGPIISALARRFFAASCSTGLFRYTGSASAAQHSACLQVAGGWYMHWHHPAIHPTSLVQTARHPVPLLTIVDREPGQTEPLGVFHRLGACTRDPGRCPVSGQHCVLVLATTCRT